MELFAEKFIFVIWVTVLYVTPYVYEKYVRRTQNNRFDKLISTH